MSHSRKVINTAMDVSNFIAKDSRHLSCRMALLKYCRALSHPQIGVGTYVFVASVCIYSAANENVGSMEESDIKIKGFAIQETFIYFLH